MSAFTERPLAATGGRWAVATPHAAAGDAAAEVLRGGGNAVDAALAAAAMLTVVYPNQCSVGGDLLALVGTRDGDVRFVNASGRSPRAVDVASLTAAHDMMPVLGALPVTVPGAVAGWSALAENWGTRPLASALAPAEAAAREGCPWPPDWPTISHGRATTWRGIPACAACSSPTATSSRPDRRCASPTSLAPWP